MTQTIDTYISQFPPETQKRLQTIRQIVGELAVEAQEEIRYGIPTFVWHGNLLHCAWYKNHIWFYPTPSVITAFADHLSCYKTSKGAIQFPLVQELPVDLIKAIVAFRVQETLAKLNTSKST